MPRDWETQFRQWEMDAKRLHAAVKSFAKVGTRKLLEEALANAIRRQTQT